MQNSPRSERQELDNAASGQLPRTPNPGDLKQISSDLSGRIYEYLLTRFADQKAHDASEFFTPVSLIANALDPACGSWSAFVQGSRRPARDPQCREAPRRSLARGRSHPGRRQAYDP
ncbi:MAG: N-6 DNA methylase [Methanomicrobiales archaeon]|nr:N-6 DNA methylase [Methanomicrobiales archaeon]